MKRRTADVTAIRTLIERWANAVRAKDLKSVLADHSADILMFDVPRPARRTGIEQYEQSWRPFFAWLGTRGVFEVDQLEIHAGDLVAFATGNIRCSGQGEDGHWTEIDDVRLTICLRKARDRWTVVHEHHSVAAD